MDTTVKIRGQSVVVPGEVEQARGVVVEAEAVALLREEQRDPREPSRCLVLSLKAVQYIQVYITIYIGICITIYI